MNKTIKNKLLTIKYKCEEALIGDVIDKEDYLNEIIEICNNMLGE